MCSRNPCPLRRLKIVFLAVCKLGPNFLCGSFKTHKSLAKKVNKMATTICFHYVLRSSLANWIKIMLPSPLNFWNCMKLMPEYVSQGFINSLSPDFCSENRKQDDHGGIVMLSTCLGLAGIFYKVVLGVTPGRKKSQP